MYCWLLVSVHFSEHYQSAPCALRYWTDMYGQLNEPPLSSMSLMSVSMGVLPTRRTKKSCSMTWAEMVRRDGSRSSSLPKRVGCPGYCVLTYSSSAHCDFSWIDSTCVTSDIPHASATHNIQPTFWLALLNKHMRTHTGCPLGGGNAYPFPCPFQFPLSILFPFPREAAPKSS